MLIHFGFGDESPMHSLRDASVSISVAALYVSACDGGLGRGVGGIGGGLVALIEVADGTTVADDKVLEAPFIAQNLLEQTGAAATGVIVETLVGTHHFAYFGILHQSLESGHVGFPKVTRCNINEVG